MSNDGKPTFSFGSAAGASGSQSAFPSFGSTPSTTSVFGAAQTATSKPATSGSSLFSQGNATAGSSLFGGSAAGGSQPSLFGAKPTSNPGSGASTPSLGGGATGAPSGGMFGNLGGASGSGASNPFGGAGASSSPFGGGFQFGQKKDDKGAATPLSNSENKAPPAGGLSFGSNASKPAAPSLFANSATSGATTPSKPTFSFQNSTTPAGPPPAGNGQASKGLFGALGGQQPFAGFSTSKPADSSSTPATTSSPFQAAGASTGGPGLFGNPKPTPLASSGTGASSTPAPTSDTPKPTFSFQSSTPAASTPNTQASSTTPAPASNLFGKPPATGSSTPSLFGGVKPATTSAAPASNLFGAAPTTTAPASSTTPSLFPGLQNKPPPSASSATSVPSTTAPAPAATPSLFSNQPTSTGAPATTAPAPGGSGGGLGGGLGAGLSTGAPAPQPGTAQPFGSSTAGPTPQLTRLKNKTMDEIITRWASDLSKYQKEFQEQAEKVAAWDRLMVENGDKIQKLYLSTYDAEKQSNEIERQLANVESQQDELASWLDRYEGEVDEMFQRQVGQGETLQGPDQERERTYKLAEKLTDRLDDMGKNLSSMIEAINDASATLSKTSKADDPLSHIVRVLNSHLAQLQWIDENATALQTKIAESQKASQSVGPNGYGGPESDAADSFYRSFMGRK